MIALSLLLLAAGCPKDPDDGACIIAHPTLVDSDVLTCACGDAIEPEDVAIAHTPSCSADDFDHGLCCEEGDGCDCAPIACGRDANGSCGCYPEYVFDFETEDERVDACEPPPGGECCFAPSVGFCHCGSGCSVGETVVASCTPESVQCDAESSKVDACS